MVGIQQFVIPVALIGLAQQVASAPLAPQAGVAVRAVNGGAELDFEVRDFEDFDFALRSLYDDELDLETRANLLKAVAPALKNIKNLIPGGKVINAAIKAKNAVVGVGKTVAKNKGKTYDRLLKTADTSMNIAKTVKTQGKRDVEDFDLVLRALYDDELDLETRANLLKAVAPALKNIKNLIPGGKVINAAIKAKNAVVGVGKTVAKNKGKTYDRLLKTADTSMNIAKTAKTQGKRDVEEHKSASHHHIKKSSKKANKKVSNKSKGRSAKKIQKDTEN